MPVPRPLVAVFGAALLLALGPAASATPSGKPGIAGEARTAGEAAVLDPAAVGEVRRFLDGLAADLKKALSGAPGGRDALRARAADPESLAGELDAFVAALGGTRPKEVTLSAFSVEATLWFGAVPHRDVHLDFGSGRQGTGLLRMVVHPTLHEVFGVERPIAWKGAAEEAFGALATGVLRTAVAGGCDHLPLALPGESAAPSGKGASRRRQPDPVAVRLRAQTRASCERLAGLDFHRVTWRLGLLSGAVHGSAGRSFTFRAGLAAGPDGTLRVLQLERPEPAGAR